MDSCTSSTIRGRYARICIQVELGKSVKTSVTIGNHKQLLVYEAERILYKLCGSLSHVAMSRPNKKVFPSSENSSPPKTSAPIMDHKEEWKIVTFQRKRNAKKSTASNPTPANHNRGNGVKNATPGKSPNSSSPKEVETITADNVVHLGQQWASGLNGVIQNPGPSGLRMGQPNSPFTITPPHALGTNI